MKLSFGDIDVGDILADFMPQYQRVVNCLVVDKKFGTVHIATRGTEWETYFLLQPLDVEGGDVLLGSRHFDQPYCTWRKVA